VFAEYSENGLKNTNIIQAHFIAALCDLQSTYKPLSNSKSRTAVALTNRFKELLHKHIREKHLVTEYASMLHVSPNHLNKTVKQITKKPTSKWIDETLITEAKVMLFQTNYSINEIASELGIYDQSYFSRLFKKYEGVTPLEYRKVIELS
jgi:YesN/AraC family two-component response regulator